MNLEVKGLRGGYGRKIVLDGVGFDIRSGSIVTLLGPNGCGKSTLLKMIGRILRPESGTILLDGKAIAQYPTGELAKRMAILPQLHHASGELSVDELVSCGRFPHRKAGFRLNEHDREVIGDSLRMTRMEELRKRRLSTLSGGERQRAWIAMTLAQEPELLLLDEPTTYLDICCQFEIIEMVRDLNRTRGITVIMVLHDLNLASQCSDRLIMMKDRSIFCTGRPSEVITKENLRTVFEIETKITLSEEGVPYCIATGSARGKERS